MATRPPAPRWIPVTTPPEAKPAPVWPTAPEPVATPTVRFVGWAYILTGLATLAVALPLGTLLLAADLPLADDPFVRAGLGFAVGLAVPVHLLAILVGFHLLLLREWARRSAVALAILGLVAAAAGIATAAFGELFSNAALAPAWSVGLAAAATLVLAGFFAWTVPTLSRPQNVALFR